MIQRISRKINRWLDAHTPVICQVCGHLMWRKDARYRHTTTGATLPLCQPCERSIYHPFQG